MLARPHLSPRTAAQGRAEPFPDRRSGTEQGTRRQRAREEVDIADPGRRLVVEFDGAYFHGRPGGLERDIAKTRHLRDSGWTVVRVREHGLTKVDPGFDITVDKDAHPYKVAVAVVEHLVLLGFLSATAAETYVQAGALQAKNCRMPG
ncbi:DUF559 domain-containing protein [Streptomyces decoyicus]|uniref:DUF559 domain-containing protein n=1 Tax=Streptomyces decoyicus TaxID=249567 RepID=UPI0037FB4E9B